MGVTPPLRYFITRFLHLHMKRILCYCPPSPHSPLLTLIISEKISHNLLYLQNYFQIKMLITDCTYFKCDLTTCEILRKFTNVKDFIGSH